MKISITSENFGQLFCEYALDPYNLKKTNQIWDMVTRCFPDLPAADCLWIVMFAAENCRSCIRKGRLCECGE